VTITAMAWRLAAATVQPTVGTTPTPLAPTAPEEFDPTTVTPGVLGFTVVLLIGIATYFLIRSMNKHLAKIPREPDTRIPPGPPRTPGNRDSREPQPPPTG
jgi:hypothetical protein